MTKTNLQKVREWAAKNAAGWVIDMLADERINRRGPFSGRRVCDVFLEGFIANGFGPKN